ncbi:uncharacterized protein [Clytia hemisphaerica]|uniref:Uncharacterized protein n=1 Tax=Clytia hemisphaerica TaxID=252671 RepID=A0A7M5WTU3_9CNID
MDLAFYIATCTIFHLLYLALHLGTIDRCASPGLYKYFRAIFVLFLMVSDIVFVVIFLFVPSIPQAYYLVSFSWFALLLINWSCVNCWNRWAGIRIEKEWGTDDNGNPKCTKRYRHSMKEIKEILDENLPKEPKVIVQCEAVEPRTSCCRKQRVIWSNQKEFEFQHWIDVTEQHLVKSQIEEAIFGELKIDFEFGDEETKESYEQHVQNLVKEAKQHSPNDQVNIKQIFEVGEKDIKTYRRSFYGKKILFGKPFVCLQGVFPQIELSFKILKWLLEKIGCKSLLTKGIVNKKVICDRNIVAV